MGFTDNSFGKGHRLCNVTLLESLFSRGTGLFAYPFRCVYLITDNPVKDGTEKIQIVITVSKRNHKRAVVRNLIKRRIREAYRINKRLWVENKSGQDDSGWLEKLGDKSLAVGLIYTPKEILDFSKINDGVRKAIVSIRKNIEKSGDIPVRDAD